MALLENAAIMEQLKGLFQIFETGSIMDEELAHVVEHALKLGNQEITTMLVKKISGLKRDMVAMFLRHTFIQREILPPKKILDAMKRVLPGLLDSGITQNPGWEERLSFAKQLIEEFFKRERLILHEAAHLVRMVDDPELKALVIKKCLSTFNTIPKDKLTWWLEELRGVEQIAGTVDVEKQIQEAVKAITSRLVEQREQLEVSAEELHMLFHIGHKSCRNRIAEIFLEKSDLASCMIVLKELNKEDEEDEAKRRNLLTRAASLILQDPAAEDMGSHWFEMITSNLVDEEPEHFKLKQKAAATLAKWHEENSPGQLRSLLKYLPSEKRNKIASRIYQEVSKDIYCRNRSGVFCTLLEQDIGQDLAEQICCDLVKMLPLGDVEEVALRTILKTTGSVELLNNVARKISRREDISNATLNALVDRKSHLEPNIAEKVDELCTRHITRLNWKESLEKIAELLDS